MHLDPMGPWTKVEEKEDFGRWKPRPKDIYYEWSAIQSWVDSLATVLKQGSREQDNRNSKIGAVWASNTCLFSITNEWLPKVELRSWLEYQQDQKVSPNCIKIVYICVVCLGDICNFQ